jgi:mRNA interferase MazF
MSELSGEAVHGEVAHGEVSRGDVWWVEFDELRPVVLLGGDEISGFEAIQVVPPSGVDISDLGVEVSIGAIDGLAYDGVVRLAFPNPAFHFCTWLTNVTAESLVERAAVLPAGKIDEIEEAVRLCSQPQEPDPAATARLAGIRDALRRGELPQHGD